MQYRYIYKNRNTGIRIQSNTKLDLPDLELIFEVRDGQIKNSDNVAVNKDNYVHKIFN